MRQFVFALMVMMLMSLSASAAADDAKTQQVPISNHNKPILVKSDASVIKISLPSNRSTGYSWFLSAYDEDRIVPLSYKYETSQNNVPGAPGTSIWTFRVREDAFNVPQVIKMKLIYARPWDLSDARKKVITVITQAH